VLGLGSIAERQLHIVYGIFKQFVCCNTCSWPRGAKCSMTQQQQQQQQQLLLLLQRDAAAAAAAAAAFVCQKNAQSSDVWRET